jgi:DNA repair exonuclease SbcCD ATPase subunit
MLSLKSLTFNNIGRFVSEQKVDFSALDRIVEVGAYNKNTGGSSGAGKSTVFHAVDYLLGINEIPATALQSRLTKSQMYAEGLFDVKGTELIVRRSKKDGLYIKFGDEEVSGNVKLAEERLEQIIGIDKKLFKKMVHKKQKEGGFFLNLTAKESYNFLMSVLGLGDVTNKTNKIDDDIKTHVARIGQLGHAIDALKSSIDEFEELLEYHKEPVCDVKQELIDERQKYIDAWKEQLTKLEGDLQNELVELKKPVKPTVSIITNPKIAELEQKVKELEQERNQAQHTYEINKKTAIQNISDIEIKLREIPFHKQNMKNSIEEMKSLMEQRKHIEDEKCPTCSQQWSGEGAKAKVEKITSLIGEIKQTILEKKELVDQEPTWQSRLEELKAVQQKIEDEHDLTEINEKIRTISSDILELVSEDKNKKSIVENQYLTELNQYNENVKEIESKYQQDIKEKKQLIADTSQDLAVDKNKMLNFNLAMAEYKEKKAKLESTIKEKKELLAGGEKERLEVRHKLSVAEESKRALKTYTLQIFQDTLDYIGAYATEILSDIPNMTGTTVYFEGCKETKSGNIKDEVNAIINMDGYNNVNIKTLSGGERTAIDLAVDLAVIDMIESKAGKGADFFILDEPFDGLEEINISQCLEILQQVDTNKKIIIVDHNPIAKEMITDRIMIERNGEESVVL